MIVASADSPAAMTVNVPPCPHVADVGDIGRDPHDLIQLGSDHAGLQDPLSVDRVHEHWRRLVPDGADERRHEPALQRLLEQDQEHEQPDGRDQQAEAHPGASHLLQREEHGSVPTNTR